MGRGKGSRQGRGRAHPHVEVRKLLQDLPWGGRRALVRDGDEHTHDDRAEGAAPTTTQDGRQPV